jgi:hypothetical protein
VKPEPGPDEGRTRSGASMVFDMIHDIVNSDRSDADVGLMLRRILNVPTIQRLRCPGKEDQTAPVNECARPPLSHQIRSVRPTWSYRPGCARRVLWMPHFGQVSVRLYGYRWLGIMWDWR